MSRRGSRPGGGGRGPQLAFAFRTWGGARAGAGRKPKHGRAGVPHRARAPLSAAHPLHVTLRIAKAVPNLRQKRLGRVVFGAFVAARERFGMRLTHFSVQRDHLHLLVEARDRESLSRALRGLAIRLAKRLNAELGRRGQVFTDRFHARPLRTPSEVRRAVLYVMNNVRKHMAQYGEAPPADWADPYASVDHFDGFAPLRPGRRPRAEFELSRAPPVVHPTTWLLAVGWKRHGLIPVWARPGGESLQR